MPLPAYQQFVLCLGFDPEPPILAKPKQAEQLKMGDEGRDYWSLKEQKGVCSGGIQMLYLSKSN